MTPLESELMKFVEKWRVRMQRRESSSLNSRDDLYSMGRVDAISDMLTELELILSIEKEKK